MTKVKRTFFQQGMVFLMDPTPVEEVLRERR
jgi:hypothetical protein